MIGRKDPVLLCALLLLPDIKSSRWLASPMPLTAGYSTERLPSVRKVLGVRQY